MKLYALSTIKQIKEKYGFKLSKSLGQNFLTDKNIIDAIIEGADIGEEDTVVEIGPGIGVITRELSQRAKTVIAVEIDRNLLPILAETLGDLENVQVINQDILKTDIGALVDGIPRQNIKIVGNLPYYITTPIIMKLLEDGIKTDSITVMMQKEVADRIKAEPGGKTYGAISVAVQYYCIVDEVVRVPRGAFVPPPNVDSAVLKLTLRDEAPIELVNKDVFFGCIRAGFGQRRKTLSNSLSSMGGMTKDLAARCLAEAGIDGARRAETLDIEEYGRLANVVAEKSGEMKLSDL